MVQEELGSQDDHGEVNERPFMNPNI